MKDILISIHRYFYTKNGKCRYKQSNKLMWIISVSIYLSAQFLLSIVLKVNRLTGCAPGALDGSGEVIVSLTSFPARINSVWMVIDSILNQSVKPAKILLYLSKEEFVHGYDDLPKSLLLYRELGLDIKFCDGNIKSHKKYLYSFRENRDSVVVTVDDDSYYSADLLDHLLSLHRCHPNAVCATTLKVIALIDNSVSPYKSWSPRAEESTVSHLNFAIGYGGVLYPTQLFNDERMFDLELIEKCCPTADDLWLKAFELIGDIPIAVGEYFCPPPSLSGSQRSALMALNTEGAEPLNDIQWRELDRQFGIEKILRSKL